VVSDGAIHVDRRGLIDHAPSSLELAAITSYGVGGSSIFRVDGGALKVGPGSVGAAPGRACFGLGGDEATITDVLLLTGLLDPATYLGGTMDLHPDRSAKAIESKIAGPLGITLDEALRRMEDAHTAEIARALLASTAVLQDTVVAAFGGAGPMTVCGAARKAGVREVLIPRTAAVFSAFGIGFSDLSQVYEQPLPDADPATISEVAGRLRQAGARTCTPRASTRTSARRGSGSRSSAATPNRSLTSTTRRTPRRTCGTATGRRLSSPWWPRSRMSRSARPATSRRRRPGRTASGCSGMAAAGRPRCRCTPC